ncbi:hypothetical protein Zmor_014118 [Zophobas morio]|uniref:Uncharacterized protein n=1 Tax=Zophobas morio TaxID=2755281 RepID=A0AA38MG55_9CUCU|nr:hypothetical protein Zmor_014118 [Zophobas morio]
MVRLYSINHNALFTGFYNKPLSVQRISPVYGGNLGLVDPLVVHIFDAISDELCFVVNTGDSNEELSSENDDIDTEQPSISNGEMDSIEPLLEYFI